MAIQVQNFCFTFEWYSGVSCNQTEPSSLVFMRGIITDATHKHHPHHLHHHYLWQNESVHLFLLVHPEWKSVTYETTTDKKKKTGALIAFVQHWLLAWFFRWCVYVRSGPFATLNRCVRDRNPHNFNSFAAHCIFILVFSLSLFSCLILFSLFRWWSHQQMAFWVHLTFCLISYHQIYEFNSKWFIYLLDQ